MGKVTKGYMKTMKQSKNIAGLLVLVLITWLYGMSASNVSASYQCTQWRVQSCFTQLGTCNRENPVCQKEEDPTGIDHFRCCQIPTTLDFQQPNKPQDSQPPASTEKKGLGETCENGGECSGILLCYNKVCSYPTGSRKLGQSCDTGNACEGSLLCQGSLCVNASAPDPCRQDPNN